MFLFVFGFGAGFRVGFDYAITSTPMIAGGLFTISKVWFNKLGRYDEQVLAPFACAPNCCAYALFCNVV